MEALDVALLPRAARGDVVGLDPATLEPVLDRVGDELRTVVAADEPGRSVLLDELLEDLDDVLCPVAPARQQAVALLAVLIQHAQDPKARPQSSRIRTFCSSLKRLLFIRFGASTTKSTLSNRPIFGGQATPLTARVCDRLSFNRLLGLGSIRSRNSGTEEHLFQRRCAVGFDRDMKASGFVRHDVGHGDPVC